MEEESYEDALDTGQTKTPESGEQQVPEILGCKASDGQTMERHVTKLDEKDQVSKVHEKVKSETLSEGMELCNEESTEVGNIETPNVPIEKQPSITAPEQQQIQPTESEKPRGTRNFSMWSI